MSGVRLRIEGFEHAQGVLRRMIARAEDLSPALDDVGAAAAVSAQARIEAERGPDGAAWPALAASTLKRRGANARALRHTARLYQSLTHQVQGRQVLVGTNVVYAAIHQFGGEIERHARSQQARWTTRGPLRGRFTKRGGRSGWVTIGGGRVRIPARPFLGLDEADGQAAATILLRHLRGEP